ncbi:cobalamin B12-binding domain-containing protein [Paenibacillus sp. IB182496]|uniref:Cobalamin B12-binding domain-containing protein n=1 Tax=Paenibacillus sabuli TaxID=2772509 RepID=A0A927BYE7_9BACL|nr:cobalamin-dependent protein [Paenibacillus sabuli]MBD2848030.1 cobalamin B12-binding domain-containing protein [Paenibacillus sabuli]
MTTTPSLSATAGERLIALSDELAELATARQYKLQPDLMERFGERGRRKTLQDTLYNIRYLGQSLQIHSPLLFSSYIHWLKVLLDGYQVTTDDLKINIDCIRAVIAERVEEELHAVVDSYIEHAYVQISTPLAPQKSHLEESELQAEANQYTELLLSGDRSGASRLIMDLVQRQISVEQIYTHIFQQSQYEIGRLWQTNQISVAQEHYFTAATQTIMSQLYPYIFSAEGGGPRLVAACIGQELHEIGLRMISDIFELHGWDTYYIGANVPTRAIIDTVIKRKADVLAVSATMTYHVTLVKNLIADIRADERCADVKVLVGGLPFNIDKDLWKQVGADGYAVSAREAIQMATHLLNPLVSSDEAGRTT